MSILSSSRHSDALIVKPRTACRLLSVGNTRLYQLINTGELDPFSTAEAARSQSRVSNDISRSGSHILKRAHHERHRDRDHGARRFHRFGSVSAEGHTVRGSSPMLALCRKLVEAGFIQPVLCAYIVATRSA